MKKQVRLRVPHVLGLVLLSVFTVSSIVAGGRHSKVKDSVTFKKSLYIPDNSKAEIVVLGVDEIKEEQPTFSVFVNRGYLLSCCEKESLHPDKNRLGAAVFIRTFSEEKSFRVFEFDRTNYNDSFVQKTIGVLNFRFNSADENLTHKFVLPKNLTGKNFSLYKIFLYLLDEKFMQEFSAQDSSSLEQHMCAYKNYYKDPLDYIIHSPTRVPESRYFYFDFCNGLPE